MSFRPVTASVIALGVLATLAACAADQPETVDPRLPVDTSPGQEAPAAVPYESAETGQPIGDAGGTAAPAAAPATTPEPAPAAAPAAAPPAAPVVAPIVAPQGGAWTAGRTRRQHRVNGVATVTAVRVARHPGLDRVVFAFQGSELPSYHVEYVDRPVRDCGSGEVIEIAGDGWLSIRLEPARGHTDAGESTLAERNVRPELPVVRQLRVTCDFEAVHEWVVGVGSPNSYRVMELRGPARLVVDIRH